MMTLGDFAEMAIDNIYDCYVWSNEKEQNVYEGILADVPDELLEAEFTSWEVDSGGRIGLNIN